MTFKAGDIVQRVRSFEKITMGRGYKLYPRGQRIQDYEDDPTAHIFYIINDAGEKYTICRSWLSQSYTVLKSTTAREYIHRTLIASR